MKLKLTTLGAGLLALSALSAPALADDSGGLGSLSGTVAVTSDYRFRGISQNDTEPALQASLNLTGNNGWYAGSWASKINFNDGPSGFGTAYHNTSVEWDIYGGKHFDLAGTDLNLEAYYYAYPDHSELPGLAKYSYFEAIVGLSHSFDKLTVNTSVAVSPAYFGETGTGVWIGGGASYAFADWLSVSANVGHQWVNELDDKETGFPYTHWDIGATATWADFNFDVRYIQTDISKSTCEGFNGPKNNWCGPTVVGTITYNFTLFGG
ncbi:MAG TPA: TorF family putative porin [Rhizomicrobium sp.]|nr:TorF family putative porin [Rhizomicrobium sp.]